MYVINFGFARYLLLNLHMQVRFSAGRLPVSPSADRGFTVKCRILFSRRPPIDGGRGALFESAASKRAASRKRETALLQDVSLVLLN